MKKKTFWVTALFSNGDCWIDGYADLRCFTDAITAAIGDINGHPILKDLEMVSIFCSHVNAGHGVLKGY